MSLTVQNYTNLVISQNHCLALSVSAGGSIKDFTAVKFAVKFLKFHISFCGILKFCYICKNITEMHRFGMGSPMFALMKS